MDKFIKIIERFAPEGIEIMEVRYQVLRQVLHKQPIGRRQLCKNLGYTERMVRNEIEILKSRGAIQTTPNGICLSNYGEEMLRDVDELLPCLFKLQTLTDKLKEKYELDKVIIVPGDSCFDVLTHKDIGRAAAEYLQKALFPGCVFAVTGGSTLAAVADVMNEGVNTAGVCVVPARGGLGEEVEQQAGTIAASIAKKIGGQYRLLHIPDNLEEGTAEALKKDIHIREVVNIIKSAHILMHGIGDAQEMAARRDLAPETLKYLEENDAVGESLRYYFNSEGKIIFEIPGIGLERSDLDNINIKVAVAGGSNKACAIEAVLRNRQENVLITDEGAAQKIIFGKEDK